MKTIGENVSNEIVIKNSRFIALFYKISSVDIEKFLDEVKELYPKATHYCYAYIYNDIKRFSDDGEPGGTAGMPILNVLEKEELNNTLCVVVRYFGGIKLGAGGLVRAYTKAVTETLKIADFLYLEKGYKVRISFKYNEEKQINYLLKNDNILEKSFNQIITYTALVDEDTIKKLSSFNYEILENVYIEKKLILN
ncbi:MAG: YigZ family protein [Bacilli bacterium]|nr:YigZ family protein [Bacilli bacterium]